ncbi:MAG: hypothetical protein MHPSP_004514, partial [Paramarteilia canceri]
MTNQFYYKIFILMLEVENLIFIMSLRDPIDLIIKFTEKSKNIQNIADGSYLDEISSISKAIIDLFTQDLDLIRSDTGSTFNEKTFRSNSAAESQFLTVKFEKNGTKKMEKSKNATLDSKQTKTLKKKKAKNPSK